METYNNRENFVNVILKVIAIALFVLLLVWLYSKIPNMTTFYNSIFSKNITYMQDNARRYFTNDKLPKNEDETIKITLRDMEDEKLIIPFVDKDGKSCDIDNSYAQVTKKDGEYVLKVYLECQGERNYVEETLGCNNLCGSGTCISTCGDLQYQYRRLIESKSTAYKCDKGYVRSGKYCYKVSTKYIKAEFVKGKDKIETVDAKKKENTTEKVYYDVIKTTTGGGTYTETVKVKVGTKKCNCTTRTVNTCASTPGCYNYVTVTTCSTCSVYETKTITKTHPTETTYNCPSGTTKEGSDSSTKCYKMETVEGELYCENSSAKLLNGKCSITIPGKDSYKCPSGYNLVDKKCYKKTTDKVKAKETTANKSVYEYKWSCKTSLEGWEKTGKTR